MELIDLHVHSNASDGTLTPAKLVALASEKGLAAIALTDHDTIAGVPKALTAARGLSIEIIPGIELSCNYKGGEIHILGLYVDPDDPVFVRETALLLKAREKRNNEMICRFTEDGMAMTRRELTFDNPNAVITRAHFARILTEKGYVSSMNQAFKKYLKYGSRWCPNKETVDPAYALGILNNCGASPVLAHPCQYHFADAKLEELVASLKEEGLAGLEVYHSCNNPYESRKLKALAVKYGLFLTGGSDFHGTNKPDIEIGCGRGNLRVSSLLLGNIKQARDARFKKGEA